MLSCSLPRESKVSWFFQPNAVSFLGLEKFTLQCTVYKRNEWKINYWFNVHPYLHQIQFIECVLLFSFPLTNYLITLIWLQLYLFIWGGGTCRNLRENCVKKYCKQCNDKPESNIECQVTKPLFIKDQRFWRFLQVGLSIWWCFFWGMLTFTFCPFVITTNMM